MPGSGIILVDDSGNGNIGTLQSGTAWVTGHNGNGLNFDGIDDRIDIANSSSLEISGRNIGISMWINPQ